MEASTEKRHKRGDVREDGKIFLCYCKNSAGGERWGTEDSLRSLRERTRIGVSKIHNSPEGKKYLKDYQSKQENKERRNLLRRLKYIKKPIRNKWKDLEFCKKYNKEWKYQKRRTSPIFKLGCVVRSRLNSLLKQKSAKRSKTLNDIIGCTFEQLKHHLESQFQEGMTWDNHGQFGWHVDHIVPMASASSIDDVYRLSHYTNLQPLWWRDNLKKWAN